MITSARQYEITRARVSEARDALAELQRARLGNML